jgi:signal transduction histidine kinase
VKNTFATPIIPDNDEERLKVLQRYEILGTPPEGAFNKIAELAVKIFNVPIALVSLVDKEQVFFKAGVGMPGVTYVERGSSLCSLAVLQNEPTIFENAADEPCLVANPLVAGSFGLKFYAGAPIITHDGYNIGTVCLVDKNPRAFSENDKAMLQDLAGIVMDELEIRISSIKAARAKSEIMHIAAHDLKNPLFNIQSLSNLLIKQDNPQEIEKMTGMIKASTSTMIALIDRLVKLSEIESSHINIDIQPVDAEALAREVIASNTYSAQQKDQSIRLTSNISTPAYVDMQWMKEILDNLISNAIKYSPPNKRIDVFMQSDSNRFYIEVIDEGLGFSPEDKRDAFKKFTKLSATPTAGEPSTGLGLSIVKTLVELHKGEVYIESEGKNKGSKLIVNIPNLHKKAKKAPVATT